MNDQWLMWQISWLMCGVIDDDDDDDVPAWVQLCAGW
jgi:hypothetical protein